MIITSLNKCLKTKRNHFKFKLLVHYQYIEILVRKTSLLKIKNTQVHFKTLFIETLAKKKKKRLLKRKKIPKCISKLSSVVCTQINKALQKLLQA